MFDSQIIACAGIAILAISITVGGIAMTGVWSATNHIVQNSGSAQLQTTYSIGKEMINTASDTQDSWNFVKSVSLLVGLPSAGYVGIRIIKNIDFT